MEHEHKNPTHSTSITVRKFDLKSGRTSYDDCLDFIYQQKKELDTSKYGNNRFMLERGLETENQRAGVLRDFERSMDKERDAEKRKHLEDTFQNLKELHAKKLGCLKTMLEVAKLEEDCGRVSNTMDCRAVQLVEPEKRTGNEGDETPEGGPNLQGFIAPSAQDCIFGLKDNWEWIVKLVKCTDIHLKNGSAYHQFFHELDESCRWMLSDFGRLHKSNEMYPLTGDYKDVERLIQEMQDMVTAMRQWESKVDRFWVDASKTVPVHYRTGSVKEAMPCRALADYETSEISIREGEDLLLIENASPKSWKVRNGRGEEASVPPLIVLIPGPFKEAIDAAVKMRLQLLAAWTDAVKRMGQRLICFMLLVFKPDYSDGEMKLIKNIGGYDKKELNRVMGVIDDTLKTHWGDHEGFINLQERLLALKMILDERGDGFIKDENALRALIVQITSLEKLMDKYRDLWKDWEGYKVSVEASRAPELMLIADKWEQLQFVSRAYFSKFWKTDLPFDDLEKSILAIKDLALESERAKVTGDEEDGSFGSGNYATSTVTESEGYGSASSIGSRGSGSRESGPGSYGSGSRGSGSGSSGSGESVIKETKVQKVQSAVNGALRAAPQMQEAAMFDEGMDEEGIVESVTGFEQVSSLAAGEVEGSDMGFATETRLAETEQINAAEMEEKKTFIIRSVINPKDDSEISLQEAIMLGIIKPDEGMYINEVTKETVPISVAMTAGLIKVQFTTTKRSPEKKSSVGVITVKTIRESIRPYVIKTVRDTHTGRDVSKDEATKLDIVNETKGMYRDRKLGRQILISEAIEKGLVTVDYIGEAPEPEVISKTYAIRAVVDRRMKKTITFHDAVRRGIIDKDSGAYKDTLTLEKMYIGDAIMRGFLKAREVAPGDTVGLDIDPENKMLVDKTEKIRKKILQPLSVISAFKKAAHI